MADHLEMKIVSILRYSVLVVYCFLMRRKGRANCEILKAARVVHGRHIRYSTYIVPSNKCFPDPIFLFVPRCVNGWWWIGTYQYGQSGQNINAANHPNWYDEDK